MILARLEPEQTLEEHLKLCLEAFGSLTSTKLSDLFKGNEELLNVAIVFHDSGKIFYQRRIKKGKGFLGHELFSTFIVDEFLQSEDLNLNFESRFLIDAIVFYHHYAMGLREREEKFLKEFKSGFNVGEEKELEEILREHEGLVVELLNLDKSAIKKAMKRVKGVIINHFENGVLHYGWIFKSLRYINKEIWDRFVADKGFRKLMFLGINAMRIVDYLGVKADKGKETDFSRVVEEFVSIYRRKIKSLNKF